MIKEIDEGLKIGIEALLENYLIQRKDAPKTFRGIINHEKSIRLFMGKNFGYQLKLDSETAKLEKIPYYSKAWMGVSDFKNEVDYVFLMALLAILETKSSDDGFLLSAVIEEVKLFLLDIYEVDWKIKHQRDSFSRVLMYAESMKLLHVLDGKVDDFKSSEDGEVLYHATSVIRYMFRNLSKPVSSFNNIDEFLKDGLDKENVHHALCRKLYFEPVVFFSELSPDEIDYIEDNVKFEELRTNIEQYTSFFVERSFQCLYLVRYTRTDKLIQHPSTKHDAQIICHVASVLSKKIENMEEKPMGLLVLKNSEFEEVLKKTQKEYSLGWSQKMRDYSFHKFREMVIKYAVEWKLAKYDDITMQITIYPAFLRTIGEYELDLREYIDEINFKEDKNANS